MPTITVPIANAELARLSTAAERHGAATGHYLRAKTERLSEHLRLRRNRAELEAELRTQLSAIPLSEVDAPDPELDALSETVVGNVPDDYRELLLEKYR